MNDDAHPEVLRGDEQRVLDGAQTRILGLLVRNFPGAANGVGGRVLVGLAGAPAAGKSTLATRLVEHLRSNHGPSFATVVPLDGFHLAREALEQRGLAARRGAIETFDAAGFADLITRLRRRDENTVFAPAYSRDLHDPVAASIPVSPETQVVIVEGNYLLSPESLWSRSRQLLDEVWYLELDAATRLRRLVERHQRFGMNRDEALAKSTGVDARNGEDIERHHERAQLIIELSDAPAKRDPTETRDSAETTEKTA
ncbi:nucleoside/nucleotide kinase family protein [Agreia sp. PsM10]|uniref:nucleoside/nucleotide kinase family protein n=1 Tax=Agreia sp. PsM10 TaxID=3030533 RepID=UPI00263B1028|nr:nucleoside/nucleotide kinase family protein [Agreia sp. PsM10]MDN4641959.1 nucleoside/nucleotide kinase family protein [Agreia sp. PsM10]